LCSLTCRCSASFSTAFCTSGGGSSDPRRQFLFQRGAVQRASGADLPSPGRGGAYLFRRAEKRAYSAGRKSRLQRCVIWVLLNAAPLPIQTQRRDRIPAEAKCGARGEHLLRIRKYILDRFGPQVIFLGSGSSVPMIQSTWLPLETFHMLGPGRSPVTSISTTGAAGDEAGSAPIMALWPGAPKGSIAASAANSDLRREIFIKLVGTMGRPLPCNTRKAPATHSIRA